MGDSRTRAVSNMPFRRPVLKAFVTSTSRFTMTVGWEELAASVAHALAA